MEFRYSNLTFFRISFDNKTLILDSHYKVSLSKNFQRQSCSGINYLSNSTNISAKDDPIPGIFGFKCTHPNRKDARFTFHERSAVQSALADLLFQFWYHAEIMFTKFMV